MGHGAIKDTCESLAKTRPLDRISLLQIRTHSQVLLDEKKLQGVDRIKRDHRIWVHPLAGVETAKLVAFWLGLGGDADS
jgi:hypothetical protein